MPPKRSLVLAYVRRHHAGLLALFVALGGTSYAAVNLPRGGVDSKHLAKGSVTTKKLAGGAVTGAKVRDGSLGAADLGPGQLPQGPRGPAGPKGDRGATGPPGPTQYARVKGDGTLVDGTALSSVRLATGRYLLTFRAAIDRCAGAANVAAYPGFDGTTARTSAHLSIAFASGGGPNAHVVRVELYGTATGAETDSAFTLVLACPPA